MRSRKHVQMKYVIELRRCRDTEQSVCIVFFGLYSQIEKNPQVKYVYNLIIYKFGGLNLEKVTLKVCLVYSS